jgi:RND family efflux transporter MFP subunit
MRGWKILALVLSLLLIIPMAIACGGQSTAQQQVQVTRGDLTIKANGSGKVEVETDAKPSFGNGGKLIKLNVKEGDKVTKGTVLAQLKTDDLELALSQAKVNEAQAQIALTKSRVDLTQAEVGLTQAQSGVTQAEAGLNTARFNLDRTKAVSDIKDDITKIEWQIKIADMRIQETLTLSDKSTADYWNLQILYYQRDLANQYKKLTELLDNDEYTGEGALTYDIMGQTYDRLTVEDVRAKQLQVEIAQKSVEEAKQKVEQARQSVELARQSIDGAQSSLDQATKAVQVAQNSLNDATVIAPIDGTAVEVNVKEGDDVPATAYISYTPMYLIDTGTMEVTAQIDEIDIAGVKLGQGVIINLDSSPDVKYEGTVKSISMAPVTSTQNSGVVVYEVKIAFNSPPPFEVKLGMSATVDILTTERKGILLVSNRAIKEDDQGNPAVDVLVNNKLESRPIKTGISDGINTEVISGLNQGDTVVITRGPDNSSLFGQ